MHQKMKKILLTLAAIFLSCLLHAQCIEDFMKVVKNNPHLVDAVNADPSLMYAWNLIKSRPQMSVDLEILEATNRLLKTHPGWVSENEDLFNQILKNLGSGEVGARCLTCPSRGFNVGIPFIHVTIDDISSILTRTEGIQNVQKLLNEMGQAALGGKKADGGAFILNVLRHKSDAFIKDIQKFEYKYLDDASFEADIRLSTQNLEYKSYSVSSWTSFGSADHIAQMTAYFTAGKFEYVANVAKLNAVAGNPTDFVKKQFQRVMKKEGVAEALYDANPKYFENIQYQGKTIRIRDGNDLRNYVALDDFFTSSLFQFVKVE